MKTNILLSSIATLFFTNLAHAGVFIEPYVGYGMGSTSGDVTTTAPVAATATIDAKETAMAYGLKLGPSIAIVAFGVDYMGVSGTSKDDTSSDKFTGTNIGAFVGVNVPMIKAALTYFVSSKAVFATSNGDGTFTGSGIKAGVGYTGLPFIGINVDHVMLNFSKAEMTGVTYGSFSSKSNFTMLSVSAPFDF